MISTPGCNVSVSVTGWNLDTGKGVLTRNLRSKLLTATSAHFHNLMECLRCSLSGHICCKFREDLPDSTKKKIPEVAKIGSLKRIVFIRSTAMSSWLFNQRNHLSFLILNQCCEKAGLGEKQDPWRIVVRFAPGFILKPTFVLLPTKGFCERCYAALVFPARKWLERQNTAKTCPVNVLWG